MISCPDRTDFDGFLTGHQRGSAELTCIEGGCPGAASSVLSEDFMVLSEGLCEFGVASEGVRA